MGLGAGGGLAFMDAPLGGSKRPSIFMVGGFGTENGTKGGVVGDMRYWADGRVQTLVGAVYAIGESRFLRTGRRQPPGRQSAALQPRAGGRRRAGQVPPRRPSDLGRDSATRTSSTEVAFDAPAATPGLPDFRSTSKVGGFTPSFSVDSRDALFTPTRGHYIEGTVGVFDDSLGSDDDFLRAQIIAMQYAPLPGKLFLGFREQVAASSEDTPFYLRPFVLMRGVPAMRYQGEEMAQLEVELRWQFWNRLSLVGFGGGGVDVDETSSGSRIRGRSAPVASGSATNSRASTVFTWAWISRTAPTDRPSTSSGAAPGFGRAAARPGGHGLRGHPHVLGRLTSSPAYRRSATSAAPTDDRQSRLTFVRADPSS